jgi:hypothetical protein
LPALVRFVLAVGAMHRMALVGMLAAIAGCGGEMAAGGDAGRDAAVDAAREIDGALDDAAMIDAATGHDAGAIDAGPRCPACEGSVVVAMRGSLGFTADCPAGEVVDFAGTQHWMGPGTELMTNACDEDTTGGGESTFYVCCAPAPADAGVDGGASGGDAGVLASGDLCDPSASHCGPGLACCYPCGIPECSYVCEPACAAGDPGCFGGCELRP